MVSEGKREEIREEAKQILERFASALEKVKIKKKVVKKEVGGFREEGEGYSANDDFRERFFNNAPKTEGDFVIAEKKKW